MSEKKIWVLVADAGRARVLEKLSHDDKLTLIVDRENPLPKTSEAARDSLPRTFDSVGKGRHAITPKTDPHRADKKAFTDDLADMLDAGLEKRSFDELVIIAPPQMVGDLRQVLSDRVKSHLKEELLLDLAHAPISEIADRLKKQRSA